MSDCRSFNFSFTRPVFVPGFFLDLAKFQPLLVGFTNDFIAFLDSFTPIFGLFTTLGLESRLQRLARVFGEIIESFNALKLEHIRLIDPSTLNNSSKKLNMIFTTKSKRLVFLDMRELVFGVWISGDDARPIRSIA